MEKENMINDLVSHVEDYIETQKELLKYKTIEKLSISAGSVGSLLIVSFLFLLVFLLLSIAFSYFLADLTGKTYIGFAIVASIYLVLALILLAKKSTWLQTPIVNSVLKSLLKDE